MPFDFTTAMIQATSPVASAPGGPAVTGAGVLVSDPAPDGTPRVVLVTARHVLANIPGGQVYLGLHLKNPDGTWRLEWRAEPLAEQGRMLWTRTIGSTVVGQAVDTIVLMIIAFGGSVSWQLVVTLIVSGYLGKVLYEAAMTPITYWVVGSLKRYEGVDTYDTETEFSPFHIAR